MGKERREHLARHCVVITDRVASTGAKLVGAQLALTRLVVCNPWLHHRTGGLALQCLLNLQPAVAP